MSVIQSPTRSFRKYYNNGWLRKGDRMMDTSYQDLLRERITQLRLKKDVSERRMSLDLGKTDSYIRSITSGKALPSLTELFNIIEYFDMTPAEFFNGMELEPSARVALQNRISELSDDDLEKVRLFISWITSE